MTDPAPRPLPQMAAIIRRLAAEDGHLPDALTLPPEQARAQIAGINARWNVDLPEMALATEVPLGPQGRALLRVPPRAGQGGILYVHGGGWATCSPETHERALRCLATACGLPVIAIRYRLAPEEQFPAGLEDVVAAWRELVASPEHYGLQAGQLVISGDSAGANLALALMLHEAAEGRRGPDLAMLFYGVYGTDFETTSYRAPSVGGLTRERMIAYWDQYLPDPAGRRDPLAAPLAAEDAALQRLPPLYLNAAALDPLLDDTRQLHARLNALGRQDPCIVHEGVIHGFMQMTTALDEARAAFDHAGRWCRATLASILREEQ